MRDLRAQERFEMEVLERLGSARLLAPLVFTGGTMLRLCHGLDRYSVDLDFWLLKPTATGPLFRRIRDCLAGAYRLRDAADKARTMLYEIRGRGYPRSLKIEVRKKVQARRVEAAIAFSPFSERQVLLNSVPLDDMMRFKMQAFLDRREIRDVFDLEFLVKRGVVPREKPDTIRLFLDAIENLPAQDYRVKLGSVLEANTRRYYATANFRILRAALQDALASAP